MASSSRGSSVKGWTPDQLGDLDGRTYLITGANSGIGLEAGRILVAAGGHVLMASRDAARGEAAVADVGAGRGTAELVVLDLADTASIRKAATTVHERTDGLDAVVNNAGVMQTPQRTTADGFELQLGTNHLGHFLLDHLLFDLVEARAGRIVAVSSIVHKQGRLHFDDLMLTDGYSPTRAYSQSKLANLVFGMELHRRLTAADSAVTAYSCHPGYSATNLQSTGPTGAFKLLYKLTNLVMAQPARKGAWPEVLAAAGTEAVPGAYYGPTGPGDARGRVGESSIARAALSIDDGRELWERSEALLGITWSI